MRVVVESLAGEFDLVRIASAAVKMALEAEAGGATDEKEIPSVSVSEGRPAGRKAPHPGKGASRARTRALPASARKGRAGPPASPRLEP